MASRESDDRQRVLDREIERYRQAATGALDQLEWSVGYLHRIHKDQLANALERNRREIRTRARMG